MSKKTTVLIVDDNIEFCKSLQDILEFKGYAVITAHDGFQALEFVKTTPVDCVLMDIKMPVMNGVETFCKLKEIVPDLPVVMMTAFAVEELIRESLQKGAFGILKKPIDFERLFSLIETATTDGMLILIVDDEQDFCRNLEDVLTQRGYRVCLAFEGRSAIEKTRENNFDIMLIDLKLPVLNGLETYLAIHEIRPHLIAIIMTGYTQELHDVLDEARHQPVYTCLEKPIDIDELLSLLEQIKERR
jgi:DNA-binding NtrC family response regulator